MPSVCHSLAFAAGLALVATAIVSRRLAGGHSRLRLWVSAFFSRWGLEVMASELLWLWLPAAAVLVGRAATSRRPP